MAITYVGSARATSGPSVVLTQASTMPTGLLAGDLVIISVARSFSYPLTNATPSGWTRDDNAIDTGTAPSAAQVDFYWRIASGPSDPAPTFTVGTASRFEIYAVAYRGASLTNPIQVSGWLNNTATVQTVSAGPLTNTDPGAWGVFQATARNAPTPATYVAPTGMTERLDTETGDATNANCTCQWADTAGAVATGTYTYAATLNQATGLAVGWAAFINPQPAPVAYTSSPADAAAGTDVGTRVQGLARTGADTAAGTDAAAPILTKGVADTAAGTDTASRVAGMVRAPADMAAITEQVVPALSRADILNYQFVMAEGPQDLVNPWVPFGFGQTISVSKFDAGSAEDRTQDQVSPVADVRHFGTDRKTPPTWGFELYTDVANESDALAWAASFEAVWDREDVRSTPGMVMPLRYRIADRVRRVYGRPGNFAAITTYARTGRVDLLCDFRLAENTFYDDAQQVQTARLQPSTRAGLTFPMTFPMVFSSPGTPRSETMVVGGTRPTWVDITFYGSVQDPWVQIGNYRWGLRGTIALGQSVRMSGVPWQMGLLRSDGAWVPGMLDPRARLSQLRFGPGTYTVTMGGFGNTSTAKAEVSWRNAYGSI